jgi:citrate lyase subunit beta/citryl-CoA lyase
VSCRPPGPALLFCPADRPERYDKAARAADVVILDLEDGVAPPDRPAARGALQQADLDPTLTIVRVNPVGTPDHPLDLEALATTPYDLVMLAKTESADQVAGLSPRQVVALCETPRGVLAATEIAACPATVAMMWGAEDLVAALGGRSSRRPDGPYGDVARHARSQVLLSAGAYGVAAIDAVHLDIGDLEGLRGEAIDAAASGFVATACIHPSQVAVVRDAYRPTEEELAWAQRVLAAAVDARGVFSFEGRMVDSPVLRHAEHIVERGAN